MNRKLVEKTIRAKAPPNVEIADPNTWVPYRPSMCRGCWAGCCTMPVRVTTEELFHMGFLEYDEVNGPLTRVAARLKKAGIIRAYYPRTRTFILFQHEDGSCTFLDKERRCTIYASRPGICRGFPFNGARPGFCPKQSKRSKKVGA